MKYTDPNPIAEGPITKPLPWISITLYADKETGEIIDHVGPRHELTGWDIIGKEIHYYEHRKRNVREILWLCRRTRQEQLSFDE